MAQKSNAPLYIIGGLVIVGFMFATAGSDKTAPKSNPIDPPISESGPTTPYLPPLPNKTELPPVVSDHWGKGHQAGYDWATDHPEVTEDDCIEAGIHSNSPSFEAGCLSLLEDKKMDQELKDTDTSQDRDPPQ